MFLAAVRGHGQRKEDPVKYLLQMIVDETGWQNLTPEDMQPMIDEMERFNDDLRQGGAWVSGEGLDFSSNARTVRVPEPADRRPVEMIVMIVGDENRVDRR